MRTISEKPLSEVRSDFDRIARLSEGRPDVLDGEERWLLRQAPPRLGEALDVGCGSGAFARQLARRARHVVGMDLSPEMIASARRRSLRFPNLTFVVADATLGLPSRRFDCVASLAMLHHVPLGPMLLRLREAVAPGGALLVLDLDDRSGWWDLPRNLLGWAKKRGLERFRAAGPSRALRQAWVDHGRGEAYPSFREVRRLCAELLPGARVRRHLAWRYSIVWRRD